MPTTVPTLSMTYGVVLCTVYVDGGHVRKRMEEAGLQYEFDPREPGRWLQAQQIIIGGRVVIPDRTVYYDALNEDAPENERERMNTYLKKVASLAEVRVGNPGFTRRRQRRGNEQKGVDVQLAVDALESAFARRDSAIAIVSGDADFAPLVDAIRRAGPYAIVLAFPGPHTAVDELSAAADRLEYLPLPSTKWQLP